MSSPNQQSGCWSEGGIPTVLIGHRTRHPAVDWVDSGHEESAHELTSIMVQSGHRELVVFNGPASVSACGLRARGFWRAIEDAGADVRWASEQRTEFDAAEARTVARSFLAERERPTAVVCGNDLIALGVMRAAGDLKLRVPDDVAVSGFDDRIFAASTNPPLTTVHMSLQRLGATATEMLAAVAENRPVTKRHVVLPTEPVIRGTTPRGDAHSTGGTRAIVPPGHDRASKLEPVRALGPAPAALATT